MSGTLVAANLTFEQLVGAVTLAELVLLAPMGALYATWRRHKTAMHRRFTGLEKEIAALRERNDTQHSEARRETDAQLREIGRDVQQVLVVLGRLDERVKALEAP